MENPEDDPREFAHPNVDNPGADSLPPGIDTFLRMYFTLLCDVFF